ncbi:hypothetical protein HYW44_03335 [Candidatus Daviesbacteria bacterium]|nr:hypothetical protein [Candidatus Daviesbacteria bacterium]
MVEAVIQTANAANDVGFLNLLRQSVPFLMQVPDAIYFQLNPAEFVIPRGEIAQARTELEKVLAQYVMTYRRDTFNLAVPIHRHLCANVLGAPLSSIQLASLQEYEKITKPKGVSLVVYQRPIVLINPQQSWLSGFYQQRGLEKGTNPT